MENLENKIEKMPLLKVSFELPTAEREGNTLFNFLGKGEGSFPAWSEGIYRNHPKLKEMVEGTEGEDEFRKKCIEYAVEYLEENKGAIEESRANLEKVWQEGGGTKFLEEIVKDFETDFPENQDKITGIISINPVNPRYLRHWTFGVNYLRSLEDRIGISVHEIIHFLYFKKWSEVFPGYDMKKYESPNPEWALSEILDVVIMKNNSVIRGLIGNYKPNVYKFWQDIKVDDKTLIELFEGIYMEHEEGKINFEEFLKRSWAEYNAKKDIVEGQMAMKKA
ncbi:MAG: hypothetical protein NTV72_00380 [Candidatus Taylorbacteria bacterium]|nr:hypothetical protein [Candidatus Taylorbacteria bacterium]